MWRIIEAYDQLNAWIRASNGQFIELDNGEAYRFARLQTFSGKELEDFEEERGRELPPEYKRFLIGVGAVDLFASPLGAGITVLGPEESADFAEKLFRAPAENPFPALLPAVSLPDLGSFGSFRPASDRDERYGVFRCEAPTEFYGEKQRYGAFDDWVADLVESRGRRI